MAEAPAPPARSMMEKHCSKFRRLFSPPTMLHNDEAATIDFAYFKPKKVTDKWTDSERIRLLKGIEEYGLHDGECWSMIHEKYLRKRQFAEVRIECCRLIGRQDLSHYCSFSPGTLDETTIEDERKKNEAMGKAEGKWVCGLYQDVAALTASQLEASRRVDFGVPSSYEALHQGRHQITPPPPMSSSSSWSSSSSSKSKKKKLKKRPHPSGIDAARQQHTASRRRVAPAPPPSSGGNSNCSRGSNSSSGSNSPSAPPPPPPPSG